MDCGSVLIRPNAYCLVLIHLILSPIGKLVESNLTYLGAEIGSNSGKIHIEKRIRCAQRAFYSLQGSGLNFQGVLPETAISIFKTVIHSTLSYGCLKKWTSFKETY